MYHNNYSTYRVGTNSGGVLAIGLSVLVIVWLIVSTVAWFSKHEEVRGTVAVKWTESHPYTSCTTDDDGNPDCETQIETLYYFQLEETDEVFHCQWGASQYAKILPRRFVSFTAYGWRSDDYRVGTRTATDFTYYNSPTY